MIRNTKQILELILNKLPFSKYSLAKRLNIPYTSLLRYLSGKNEGNFSDVLDWLENLHLFLNNGKICFLNYYLDEDLSKLDKSTCCRIFSSLEDSDIWTKEGMRDELNEGHSVAWLHKSW